MSLSPKTYGVDRPIAKHEKKGRGGARLQRSLDNVFLHVSIGSVSPFLGDVHSDPWDDPVFDGLKHVCFFHDMASSRIQEDARQAKKKAEEEARKWWKEALESVGDMIYWYPTLMSRFCYSKWVESTTWWNIIENGCATFFPAHPPAMTSFVTPGGCGVEVSRIQVSNVLTRNRSNMCGRPQEAMSWQASAQVMFQEILAFGGIAHVSKGFVLRCDVELKLVWDGHSKSFCTECRVKPGQFSLESNKGYVGSVIVDCRNPV